jgi:hypothetical protein
MLILKSTSRLRDVAQEPNRDASTSLASRWRESSIHIGPRMDPNDGRVLPNFIVQALRDKDVAVVRAR